jgi:DNA-binding PadR family transcriptional regulator
MDGISEKELVILGMLYEKPMYGYEIEKQISDTSMRDWTEIGFSSIYYILKKLKLKKLIELQIILNEKNQARKMYHITDKGKNKAKTAIKFIISNNENVIWRVDLGLAYLNLLEKSEILESLGKYKKSIEEKINGYNDLLNYLKEHECSYNRYELAYRPIYLLEAELKWVVEFISKI